MAATYTKPTKIPRWADTGTTTEPAEAKKDAGWTYQEVPPSSYENWKAKLIGEWFKWLDERLFDGASSDELLLKSPGDGSDALRIADTYVKTHKELRIDGSDNFVLLETGGDFRVGFKGTSGNSYMEYDSSSDSLKFFLNAVQALSLSSLGGTLAGMYFLIASGIDLNGKTITGGTKFGLDATDYIEFQDNYLTDFVLNNVVELRIRTQGVRINKGLHVGAVDQPTYDNDAVIEGGLVVGFTGTDPSDDEIMIGDTTFKLTGGTEPTITFDTGDALKFTRSSNLLSFEIGGTAQLRFSTTDGFFPGSTDETLSLGSSTHRWSSVYAKGIQLSESDDEVMWSPAQTLNDKPVVVYAKNTNVSIALSQYEIVALDDQTADQVHVKHSTSAGSNTVFGVAQETITAGNWGKVAIFGPTKIKMVSGAVTAGDLVGLSSTSGSAAVVTAAGDYAIGQLTQSHGSGGTDVQVWLTGSHGTG